VKRARRDYDYAVLGLGGIGGAAAYWLSRRAGSDVLGLEQFGLGHDFGASQDHSRIIRHSYHSTAYAELSKGAYAAWDELAEDLGSPLVVKTGGLDLWPAGAAIPMRDYTDSLSACAIPFELIDSGEVIRRWPQFKLADDTTALYQEDGGIVPAAKCNAAHTGLARRNGATLLERSPVSSLRPSKGEIELVAGSDTYRCGKLVVAADAWTNDVLRGLDVELPLTITQEQVTYWSTASTAAFAPDRFPVWIWMDEPSFYGLPVYGEAGIKAGQDVGGRKVTPATRTFDVDEAALERVTLWLKRHLPEALGPILYTKSCLYTMPPDRDFVVDRLPEHRNVFVVLGAAHGFKFASLLGKILSELVVDGRTDHDISSFRIDRSALRSPGRSGPS
jgi:sarcosine oxidase